MCSNPSIDSRPTVVVLDANIAVRSGVEALLRTLHTHVAGFASAGEFLAALDRGLQPDCLVVDLSLPDLSAVALLAELKRRARPIPTILLSGDSEIDSAVEAMRAGAITCIEKPYIARFLLEQVAPLLDDSGVAPRGRAD